MALLCSRIPSSFTSFFLITWDTQSVVTQLVNGSNGSTLSWSPSECIYVQIPYWTAPLNGKLLAISYNKPHYFPAKTSRYRHSFLCGGKQESRKMVPGFKYTYCFVSTKKVEEYHIIAWYNIMIFTMHLGRSWDKESAYLITECIYGLWIWWCSPDVLTL